MSLGFVEVVTCTGPTNPATGFSEVMSLGFVEVDPLISGVYEGAFRFSEVMSLGFVEVGLSQHSAATRKWFSEVMSLGFVEVFGARKRR